MTPQREWFEKDYYKVLGVSETATPKEIKSAFRKLSRQFHPDTNSGDADARRSASRRSPRRTTSSATRRSARNTTRRAGSGRWAAASVGPGGYTFTTDNLGDLGDLFGNLFNRGARSGSARAAWRRPAARCRSRDRAAAVVSRRGAGRHHHGQPHERRCLPQLSRHRRQARERRRTRARVAAAAACSTRTRVSSRSASRAPSAEAVAR